MKIELEIELEFVTLTMTSDEAETLAGVIGQALNDRNREQRTFVPEGDATRALDVLGRLHDRLQDAFYKHQQN